MKTHPKPDDLLEQLQAFPLFEGIPAEPLQWLIDNGEYLESCKDEMLFEDGQRIDHMQIVLKGSYIIRRNDGERKREVGVWSAPYVMGILPFSRMKETSAEGMALEPTYVLQLHKSCFTEMVNVSYDLVERLVSVMTDRVRDFQNIRLMDEKLMALGKMSAGLAHELNNPASAMVRASRELHRHLGQTPERFKALVTMRTTPEAVDEINEVLFERIRNHDPDNDLSLLEREELTDDLTDWFENNDLDGEDVIDTFIDWNFSAEHLQRVADAIPREAYRSVLWWLETNLTTEGLVDEIQRASGRIADLVSSIKSYSHMDSEPSMEFVDIHKGIKSTLTMLKFKFKKKNVRMVKTCNVNLPNIKALEGELNQVWTNLIVNALDVVPTDGSGQIEVKTYQQRSNLCVEVIDNGPGIPEDIQSRIFEPFFTTKGIGEGTGMGLDIVTRALKRHHGTVGVESEPGRTVFRVCFPL